VPRFVIIAGEASGDILAGGLVDALREIYPDAQFEGITGPRMKQAGVHSWGGFQQLAIMGLFEVIRHLPRLWKLKRDIERRLAANPPDVFIGIDAPDFNLRIERYARKAGIATVHYVCPSVWAWRQSRVKTIRACCDLVLCLLPFESSFLEQHQVRSRFVGHPLADEIKAEPDAVSARHRLTLPAESNYVALLPGSRMGEVKYLGPAFVEAAQWLHERKPELRFLVAAANPAISQVMASLVAKAGLQSAVDIISGDTLDVMMAADSVLLASGTATLETMLIGRPMVVSYKVFPLTAWLLRNSRIVKIERFALPNLLADAELVPEILQEEATGPRLGAAILEQLEDPELRVAMTGHFARLGELLRRNASTEAARGVAQLIDKS
jgi:lipid-A-disaccharide synthase